MRAFIWQHFVFHILCRKDEDYAQTGGGTHRNEFCHKIADKLFY